MPRKKAMPDPGARRIVACLKFCRGFCTEYLEGRHLVLLKSVKEYEDLQASKQVDGLIPVMLNETADSDA